MQQSSDQYCNSRLSFWRPLLPYGYSCKAFCVLQLYPYPYPSLYRLGQAVICNFWYPGTLTLSHERQSARMSNITNAGLIRSGTGCFIAVATWQRWASKGYVQCVCTMLLISTDNDGWTNSEAAHSLKSPSQWTTQNVRQVLQSVVSESRAWQQRGRDQRRKNN